jgi:phosphate transport system substrate-binding protein
MKRKLLYTFLVVALGLFSIFSGAVLGRKSVTLKGSDTMVILGQRWAEEYMKANPDMIVQVTGGGSGTGIAALINGTTDIAQASRPMKLIEKEKLRDRFNTMGNEIPVAKDGLAVYLNEANPVQELTLAQLKDIYTGKTTNWKEVGGPDSRIILYGRENNSGTYVFFKDNVLNGEDYAPATQTLPGTAAVVNAIAKDKNGIGYGGAAYAKGVKYTKVKKDERSPGVEPNLETVSKGTYPIWRYLNWYTRNKPSGDVKKFVDYVLSKEGQQIVTKVGYFPVN